MKTNRLTGLTGSIPSFTLTKVLYWHYNLKRYDSSNHLEQVHYLRNRLS